MRRLIIAAILVLLAARVGLTPMTAISSTAQQGQLATMRFSSSSLTIEPDQTFSLAVVVEDVADLAGFDIQFSWNTTCLAYVNHTLTVPVEDYPDPVSPSPYAGILHDPVFVLKNQINVTAGTYWGAASRLTAAFNGSGTAITIAFRALEQPGSTYLQFTNHELANHEGIPIPSTVKNSSVNIWRLRVSIVSPENKTYSLNNVPLTFNLSKPASWIGYSLDGKTNATIGGNVSLSGLSKGLHSLVVSARDVVGNMGSSSVLYFTIEETALEPFQVGIIVATVVVAALSVATLVYMKKFRRGKEINTRTS